MLDDEAKIKFLRKIAKNDNTDIVDIFKKSFPYKRNGIAGYEFLTKRNAIPAERVSVQGILNLSKQIYDLWYDYVVGLYEDKFDNESTRNAIKTLRATSSYKKENMSPQQCYDFIFRGGYDTVFKKDKEFRPMWAQIDDEPISKGNVCPDFIHFSPFLRRSKATCRLYLNLKPENAAQLGGILAGKCKEQGIRLYGKLWTLGADRNDTFLIYTTFKNVEKVISILEDIHKEKPELFEGAEKMNDFVCKVNSFIGYGDEPEYKHSSFNQERGEAIDEFYKDLLSNEYREIGNFSGEIRNSYGENLNLKEYLVYKFKSEFLKSVDNDYNDVVNGVFPVGYDTEKEKKTLVEFYMQLRSVVQRTIPNYIEKQFENMADNVIESLKRGETPTKSSIKVRTRNVEVFPQSNQKRKISENQRKGYMEFGIAMNFSLTQKLFEVFNSEERMKGRITKENIKPYCDKHHISMSHPCLNLESDRCL